MSLMIAILAGICPDWWPRRFPPRGGGGTGPQPDPWRIFGGVIGAIGGALAWLTLGGRYGNDGGLAAPLIIGLLGGTAALWLADAIAGGMGGKRPQP